MFSPGLAQLYRLPGLRLCMVLLQEINAQNTHQNIIDAMKKVVAYAFLLLPDSLWREEKNLHIVDDQTRNRAGGGIHPAAG